MIDYILNGGISIHPAFFENKQFDKINSDMHNLTYIKGHQPQTYYGNRLQAYPVYESHYDKETEYITNKLEVILQTKVVRFTALARKTLMSEVQQSSQGFEKYGFIHTDTGEGQNLGGRSLIAGMMYFDQSFDGGTAFFNNYWEKVPDIYVSAYPNRLLLYDGGRWHSPALDYTFEERLTLSFFFTIEKNGKK
jgi:hypothetical protein